MTMDKVLDEQLSSSFLDLIVNIYEEVDLQINSGEADD